jgi:hypothetical protein
MKKTAIIILLLAVATLLPARGDKLFLSAGAGLLAPRDAEFKEFYGATLIGPELRLGLRLYRGFFALLGVGYFPASGTIPVIEEKASVSQILAPVGFGWETGRGGKLQGAFHAALLLAAFNEKAMGSSASKMALGFDVGGELRYYLKRALFLELAVAYAGAATSVKTEAREVDIELGGLCLGLRLGFRF